MTKDEALKLARTALGVQLDALLGKAGHLRNDDRRRYAENGIKAIDEALAQPEQEPVVWMYQDKSTHEVRFQKHMRDFIDHSKTSEVPLYSEPLANHELQCVCGAVWCGDEMVHLPNKAQPQRKPLTDEEIANTLTGYRLSDAIDITRAIEAAHGIGE